MAELAPHHPPATNSDVDKHDQAFSIDELEYIRSRLFQLLDRVNKSMMEKVLQHESLTQCSIGRLRSKNIDELSMNELMDKLSQDSNTLTTSSFGKRSHCDGLESAEMGNKRQCRPCPVCHETTAESSLSASVGSCEICEVNGLCQRCYSSCPSCQRTTCADCLLSCADCGTRHQCSDCAVLLEGKCIICREKPKTVHQCVNGNGGDGASRRELAPTDNVNMNVQQTSTYSNKLVCIPHRSQTSLELPQSCLTGPAPLIHLPPSAPAPSHPQNYVAPLVHQQKELLPTIHDIQTKPTPMTSELLSIHGFHKSQKPAPVVHQQKVSLSTTSDILTKSTPTTSELFSIHRFLISEEGMIGINVSTLYPNRRCIVSNVIPNSVAFYLGVEVDDEIIVPTSTTFEYSNIYDLFLNAIKHRPLLFEVKRAYKSNEVPETLTLDGPHCLHRFTITEPGSLGITIIDHGSTATIVSRVVPNSLGDIYGLRVNDIICEPFESVLSYAKSGKRPWILEVWRAVPTTTDGDGLERLHVQAGCSVENPFIFSFPIGNTVSKDHTNLYNRDEVEGNTGQADGIAASDKGNVGSEVIVLDDDDE
ncbi:hypothetical protein ACHAWU_010043 [Discostella pseudostelligera]|uniref:Uncharacterized protein n=1 Tax=Discostella pseudostelligera TaxID=259834 RepID=A0ABD3N6T5_9STRA